MDAWADEIPLFIWAGGNKADLTPLKEAKAALGITQMVRPKTVPRPDFQVYLPEGCDRILAIGERSPWVCDYALVGEGTSAAGWQAALAWCLHLVAEDPRATTVEDIMRSIWPDAREIPAEELESEKKMSDYINRVS